MTEEQKKALDQAVKELMKMSPEEFHKALEKHKNGEWAKLIEYGLNPHGEDNG